MSDEKYEYPDEAGYPDGRGTLDEGTAREGIARQGTPGGDDAEADAAEAELGEFAMQDEEDVEGV
ncbi:hypothetical protein [Agromyces silvae]|uniref:hypothetical protein n=1 Tax=Agromyces silvae TaxID=3388266 RepID=UPI00280B066C|nr:hypothetical protein [Agromyces protaetiae]